MLRAAAKEVLRDGDAYGLYNLLNRNASLDCSSNDALIARAPCHRHTSITQFLTRDDGQTTTALRHSVLRWRSTQVQSAMAVAVFPSPISSASIAPRPSYLTQYGQRFQRGPDVENQHARTKAVCLFVCGGRML